MIKRYVFGTPILDTESVIHKPEPQQGNIPYFDLEQSKNGILFKYPLEPGKPVYGLGENVRGINKRGFRYVSFCGNSSMHVESLERMYCAHNFLIVDGKNRFGLYVDSPGRVEFDIGFTRPDEFVMTSELTDFELYIMEEETLSEIVRSFRRIIGQSYIPPRWAFGYQQCRWGYESSDEIRKVVAQMKANRIPLDSVGLDLEYLDDYKDFTINPEHYSDFAELSAELKEQGVRLVPIIDAGVKIEKGYPVYEEGVEKGYFFKDKDGNDFVGAVWPGRCHFPDFLRPEVRDWFGGHYKYLTDMGIEGFWNDMNEPTLFFTERGLAEAMGVVDELRDTQLDIPKRRRLLNAVNGMANNLEDYRSIYHNIDGKLVRHDKVHNLYGYNMTRSAAEAVDKLLPNHRILITSRSSFVGMHRYAGTWQGDNYSWWSHLLLNLKMMPSLNMCGFLFTGADLGGFHTNVSEDLLIRWLQLAVFTPLMRNHSAFNTRRQEPYLFVKKDIMREMIRIRYMLIPYLYTEFVRCALENDMLFRPLAFEYEGDAIAAEVEDQMLVGDAIMIAPVYTQNAHGRTVYLPEDMMMIRLSSPEKREYVPMKKGHHYIRAELDEMVFFLRPDKVLPITQPGQTTQAMDFTQVELLCNVSCESECTVYHDDGFSKDYENPDHYTTIHVIRDEERLIVNQRGAALGLTVIDTQKAAGTLPSVSQ